jgi:hypothetical protein
MNEDHYFAPVQFSKKSLKLRVSKVQSIRV